MISATMKDIKISFNAKTILTPAEKMCKKLLSGFGGYTRAVMRNSIKPAGSFDVHAKPGQPPLYHTGPIKYKDTIFFVVDTSAMDCTIGGALLSGTKAYGQPVPGDLEQGGSVLRIQHAPRWQHNAKLPGYIAPHPHAVPAFKKAVDKFLPKLIEGGIMREA